MTVIRRVPGGHEVRKRERTRKPTRGRHLQQWRPDSRLKSVLRGNLHSAGVARKCATISHNGGRIHDANGYGLTAAALELGALATHGGIVPDREDVVLAALEAALGDADVLITSGGVSAGAYDTVKAVLRRLGTVTFEKVAMQPGMPQGFGTLGDRETPIFTLPGNPVSSMVSFEIFVRPVLRKLAGEISLHRHVVPAVSALPWSSPRGKRQFVRAVIERRSDGVSVVSPVGGQGSHLVADLADATCLAVVPEQVTEVTIGMTLNCILLDRARR